MLEKLIEISRRYGADPNMVLAGGGNTSFKDQEHLYVKASGTTLATIDEKGFVKMDRKKLAAIWEKEYPEDIDTREEYALKDLMDARDSEFLHMRPSVETLMHSFLPYTYVVHTHPALVNGLSCSRDGEKYTKELFGDVAVWVPTVNPGYILANLIKKIADNYQQSHGAAPKVIILQNHGIVVAADTAQEIDEIYNNIFSALYKKVLEDVNMTRLFGAEEKKNAALKAAKRLFPKGYCFETGNVVALDNMLASVETMEPLMLPFSPDHIVYAGHEPLYCRDVGEIEKNLQDYESCNKVLPKIIAMKGLGVIGCGETDLAAKSAVAVFFDAVKVAWYSQFFGGSLFMPQDQIDFIRNWEVEKYRKQVSTGGS